MTTDGASLNNQNRELREGSFGYLIEQNNELVDEVSEYIGQGPKYTNNYAEYQAVINGVRHIKRLFPNREISLSIKSDSELLVKQITGEYSVNKMEEVYEECIEELSSLKTWQVEHVSKFPGNSIERADNLAAEAFD